MCVCVCVSEMIPKHEREKEREDMVSDGELGFRGAYLTDIEVAENGACAPERCSTRTVRHRVLRRCPDARASPTVALRS